MRSKAGYGAILALGIFLSALILATLILSAMVPPSRVSSEGSGLAREAFEQKRGGIRVLVWSYLYSGPGRGAIWQRPYLYIVIDGGYSVLVKDILFLEEQDRSSIDPVTGRLVRTYSLNRIVEPSCLMMRLDRVERAWRTLAAFNRSVSHIAVIADGKAYYGTVRMPNATMVYPCTPDMDRNSFDLHIVASPSEALSQVVWTINKGSCQEQERRGNQIRVRCSAHSVVTLIALTTQSYAFEAWKIEGERVTESKVTLALDDDYTVNADFRRR
jgi:hypothetical protein